MVADMVAKLEDSQIRIKSITLTNIWVTKHRIAIPIEFRQIKMYGTLFNYNGYGINAINYDGACVPNHILKTYNNPEITNPRNKTSKLTMPKLL